MPSEPCPSSIATPARAGGARSGTPSGPLLTDGEVLTQALADFGIRARTRTEKLALATALPGQDEEVSAKYRDFCKLILQAREKMQLAIAPLIFTAWVREDDHGRGVLEYEGMMQLLAELNPDMKTDNFDLALKAKSIVKDLDSGGDNQFSFHEAEQIVWRLREFKESKRRAAEYAIRDQHALSQATFQEFREQLVEMHDAFVNVSELRSGKSAWNRLQLMHMQSQFGLPTPRNQMEAEVPLWKKFHLQTLRPGSGEDDFPDSPSASGSPRAGEERRDALPRSPYSKEDDEEEEWWKEAGDEGASSFEKVLVLCREQRARQMRDKLADTITLFGHYDKDKSGQLEMQEICQILDDMELLPKSGVEQMAIAQMIEEVDADGSGYFSFDEFELMIQRILETLAQIAYKAETSQAASLEYTADQIRDLREIFYECDTTSSGSIDRGALTAAVSMMGFRVSAAKLKTITDEIDVTGSEEFSFTAFARVLRAIQDDLQRAAPALAPTAEGRRTASEPQAAAEKRLSAAAQAEEIVTRRALITHSERERRESVE